MIDRLDEIAWNELTDAYGSATRVPSLIEGLVQLPSAKQLDSLQQLAERINHQASRFQATLPAIPFLLSVLSSPRFRHKERMLSLLLTIAIGLDADQLHFQARMSSRSHDEYNAVSKGSSQFLGLLKDRDRGTRIQAAYNLAWFPGVHRKSLPRLREIMQSTKNTEEFVSAVLSVGLLEFQAEVKRPSRGFVRPLLDDRREVVRYAAALYLYWHDRTDQVLSLIEQLSNDDRYDCYVGSRSYRFAGYAWNQYAQRLLEI